MKIVSILMGQAIRLFKIQPPPGGMYFPDIMKALQERYGFVQIPTTLEGYDPLRGITVFQGKFKFRGADGQKEIVIVQFQMFNDGLVVNTQGYAEEADLFIDDVIKWFLEKYGATIYPASPIRKLFNSSIEIHSDVALDSYFHKSNKIGKQISEMLVDQGFNIMPYTISSFSLHFDTYQKSIPIPSAFILSRREQQPYSSNLYFSSAPLLTSQHISLLQAIEKEIAS